MPPPDDYALSPIKTLARVALPARNPQHGLYFRTCAQAIFGSPAHLSVRSRADVDPSDTTATHEFTGYHSTRIGCHLVKMPESVKAKAGLIVLHGYTTPQPLADQATDWQTLAAQGVQVMLVRHRGYPGSQTDVGDLTANETGWITHGLDVPVKPALGQCNWVYAHAAADTAIAVRALSHQLGENLPIYISGDSLGAALAVIAAATLATEHPIARLAIATPSMGDWPWRYAHRCGGAGGQIAQFILANQQIESDIKQTLSLFDTVVHARRVASPVLCKLAQQDDVVPAPSAAAVFNSLGTPPGLKWRFITAFGHHDGGIADARHHAQFKKIRGRFLDPNAEPTDTMRQVVAEICGDSPHQEPVQ